MRCGFIVFLAIQFVLSDEFSHLRPEQRLALLHVSALKTQIHYKSEQPLCLFIIRKNLITVVPHVLRGLRSENLLQKMKSAK